MSVEDREIGLDLLRGIAMITIVINHVQTFPRALGYLGKVIPTLTTYGFSSAAEIFVAISGYMVGFIYAKKPNYPQLLASRSARLYATNLVILCAILPLWGLSSTALLDSENLLNWQAHPVSSLVEFLTFQSAPTFLDVLQMYEIMMIVAVPAVWLLRRSWLALLLLSFLVYAGSQVWVVEGRHIPGNVTFWIPAWQFIFIVPMIAGRAGLHASFVRWARSHRVLVLVPLALILPVVAYVKLGTRLSMPAFFPAKVTLHPARIVHASAVIATYVFLISWTERWHGTKPARLLALLGRHSLLCFSVSLVATYYLTAIIYIRTGGLIGYLVVLAVVLLCVWLSAAYSQRRKINTAQVAKSRQP